MADSHWAQRHIDETGEIPGWFWPVDVWLFTLIDEIQRSAKFVGDLLEIGTYMGKSAIALGRMQRDSESLTVVDPWESAVSGDETAREKVSYYGDVQRATFEANYSRFHGKLPDIRQGLSGDILSTFSDDRFRFVHVDGAHDCSTVAEDAAQAARVAIPGGVVVFDDINSAHLPGVAAAIWPKVAAGSFVPVAITTKLYCTVHDGPVSVDALRSAVEGSARLTIDRSNELFGREVLGVEYLYEKAMLPDEAARWLPPVVIDAIRRLRLGEKIRAANLTRSSS